MVVVLDVSFLDGEGCVDEENAEIDEEGNQEFENDLLLDELPLVQDHISHYFKAKHLY